MLLLGNDISLSLFCLLLATMTYFIVLIQVIFHDITKKNTKITLNQKKYEAILFSLLEHLFLISV